MRPYQPPTPHEGDPDLGSHDCLIIGAGLAGLTAARRLGLSGRSVLVVDKGRSPGGRLATRRIGRAVLDHGAQFFTVRTPEFQAEVDRWMAAGVVSEWTRGFTDHDGHPRYRAVAGMNAIAKYLASELDGLSVRLETRVRAEAVIGGPDRWTVVYQGGPRLPDLARSVIATPPVPQALELLAAGAVPIDGEADPAGDLAAVRYHKVIALLMTLDRSPSLPAPGARQQPDDPVFTFVADNQAKGISPLPAVTFHLAPELSGQLWDLDDRAVLAHVDNDLRSYLGGAPITEVQVKRWRYAGPINPFHQPFAEVAIDPGPLLLAGDCFAQSKVEGAFLSGRAAANHVAEQLAG